MSNPESKTVIITGAKYCGLSCLLVILGCASTPQQPTAMPDTRAADEAAIRKADADWVAAAQSKQVDQWVSFYSDDAVVLAPNEKIATDKETIRKGIDGMLGMPALSIGWKLAKVDVARSGDIGYGYGTYELSAKDPKGKPISDHGKLVEIWKKQSDGTWKCVVDTWNSDPPAVPARSKR